MCGILGIVYFNDKKKIDKDLLKNMRDQMLDNRSYREIQNKYIFTFLINQKNKEY